MAGHAKDHAINSVNDHNPGTDDTLMGTEAGAIVEKFFSVSATASRVVIRDGNADVVVPYTPSSDAAAVSKRYVDERVVGRRWPVAVMNMKSDANMGGVPPGGAVTGNAYVVNNWGFGYNNGDIVEYDGALFNVIVANVGGLVADMTRVIVAAAGVGGTFAGQTNKYAMYRTAGGWSFTLPDDGNEAVVYGAGSIYENLYFIWDATPGIWRDFGANLLHNSLSTIQGGTVTERYHLASAQYTQAIKKKSSITAAGNAPLEANLTGAGWVADDWGFYRSTGNNKSWLVWYRSAGNVDYVQL